MTAPSCKSGTGRSVDRGDVSGEVRPVDCHTINSGTGHCGPRLQRLKLPLSRYETIHAARLDSLVLLVGKLSQPIRRGSQIVAQHRAAGNHLVLNRLFDQLVLTDSQPGGHLGRQNPQLLITPTQWKYSSRCHASQHAPQLSDVKERE
jgi:hypothetical protein